MKAYTDLEQSKKLTKILPLKSADMCYKCIGDESYDIIVRPYSEYYEKYKLLVISKDFNAVPCWSLAALLSVLDFPSLTQNKEDEWEVCIPNHKSEGYIEVSADNPVDACVEMIEKLHEQKLL